MSAIYAISKPSFFYLRNESNEDMVNEEYFYEYEREEESSKRKEIISG